MRKGETQGWGGGATIERQRASHHLLEQSFLKWVFPFLHSVLYYCNFCYYCYAVKASKQK